MDYGLRTTGCGKKGIQKYTLMKAAPVWYPSDNHFKYRDREEQRSVFQALPGLRCCTLNPVALPISAITPHYFACPLVLKLFINKYICRDRKSYPHPGYFFIEGIDMNNLNV